MPEFKYEALDKRGKLIRGTMDAPDVDFIAAKLRSMGYYPTKVEAAVPTMNPGIAGQRDLERTKAADERIRQGIVIAERHRGRSCQGDTAVQACQRGAFKGGYTSEIPDIIRTYGG